METLGERIRKLRKQQKLTLEELAGDTLTKGMLSLIENNKANPSMESLSFIAERLDVEVSELLEEVSNQELRELLTKVEKIYHTDSQEMLDKYTQIHTLIKPYAPKLTQGYEAARLLDLYSRALYDENIDGWKVYSEKAASLYEQMNIAQRRARIGIFRSLIYAEDYDYKNALKTFQFERSEIEQKCTFIDPMTRVDLDYTETTLLFAVGKSEEALKMMESGIIFSKEEQILYRIDHLYRIAVFHAMMIGEQEKLNYYTKKIELYGELTDDIQAVLFVKFMKVHYLTSYKKTYKKALDLLEQYSHSHQFDPMYQNFYHFEKGKALFGLQQYEKAMKAFKEVKYPDYSKHPFDLAIFYEVDAYRALCYKIFGNREQALTYATLAYENISPMPHTPYKDFINETYEKIRNNQ